jgi:F-type H+-transporting ATPase subunit c
MKKLTLKTLSLLATAVALSAPALAQDGGKGGGSYTFIGLGALAVGIAAAGCGIGDGNAIAAACEGTARNPGAGPRIFTLLITGLALIESLTILTFVLAFLGR